MKKLLLLITLIFITNKAFAGSSFILDNISRQEIDDLAEELGADWVFSTVSSAKPTGDLLPIIGIEVGVVAGATDAPTWNRIIKEEDPNTDIDKLPYLNLIGTVSFKPLGLTFELGMIPEKSTDNASIKNTALGVKWTFINNVLYQVAVRGHVNSNELSFTDDTSIAGSSAIGTTSFETTTAGVQLLVGADLLGTIEPYAGIGFVKASTDTKLSANIDVEGFTLSASEALESSSSSAHFVAGAVIDLFIINLGVEYMNALGTSRIAGKFSLNF